MVIDIQTFLVFQGPRLSFCFLESHRFVYFCSKYSSFLVAGANLTPILTKTSILTKPYINKNKWLNNQSKFI